MSRFPQPNIQGPGFRNDLIWNPSDECVRMFASTRICDVLAGRMPTALCKSYLHAIRATADELSTSGAAKLCENSGEDCTRATGMLSIYRYRQTCNTMILPSFVRCLYTYLGTYIVP